MVTIPRSRGAELPFEQIAWSRGGHYLSGFCQTSCPSDTRGRLVDALYMIDRESGALSHIRMAKDPTGASGLATFAPDDAHVLVALDGEHVRLVRTKDGTVVSEATILGSYDYQDFAPDGSATVIGSVLGAFTLLGLPRGNRIAREEMKNPFAVTGGMLFGWPDHGRRLLVAWDDVRIFSSKSGAMLGRVEGLGISEPGSTALVTLEESALLASCSGAIKQLSMDPFTSRDLRGGSKNAYRCPLFITPDGKSVYLGDESGLSRFDVEARKAERLLGEPISGLSPSRDGRLLAVTQRDGEVLSQALDAKGTPLAVGHGSAVGWSAEGELYVKDGAIVRVWSPAKRAFTHEIALPSEESAGGLALSPDGRFLAGTDGHPFIVRTFDKTALRIEMEGSRETARLTPSAQEITAFFAGRAK